MNKCLGVLWGYKIQLGIGNFFRNLPSVGTYTECIGQCTIVLYIDVQYIVTLDNVIIVIHKHYLY